MKLVDDEYERVSALGEGTYGTVCQEARANTRNRLPDAFPNNTLKHTQVFLARSKSDPTQHFALKRIRMENEKEGFPITAIREIKLLAFLGSQPNPQNVIKLHDVVRSKGTHDTQWQCATHEMCRCLGRHVAINTQQPSKTSSSQPSTWSLSTWTTI